MFKPKSRRNASKVHSPVVRPVIDVPVLQQPVLVLELCPALLAHALGGKAKVLDLDMSEKATVNL